MEFKLEGPWDKTPAHQVFIPVHKNNYFKVIKKKKTSLLGKQMEPHASETVWEKTANSGNKQQMHVKQGQHRVPHSQTRLWERLEPLKSHQPSGEHMDLLSSPQASVGYGEVLFHSCTPTLRISLHFRFFNAALQTLSPRTLSPSFLSLLSLKINTQAFMVERVC